jgi:hypothetical protein
LLRDLALQLVAALAIQAAINIVEPEIGMSKKYKFETRRENCFKH